MKRKNILSLVIGIISSLSAVIVGLIGFVVILFGFALGEAIDNSISGNGTNASPLIDILVIFCIVVMFAGVVGFVGSIFCAFKVKVGGIIQIISAVLCLTLPVAILIQIKTFEITLLIFFIPFVLFLVSGITAVLTKAKAVDTPKTPLTTNNIRPSSAINTQQVLQENKPVSTNVQTTIPNNPVAENQQTKPASVLPNRPMPQNLPNRPNKPDLK